MKQVCEKGAHLIALPTLAHRSVAIGLTVCISSARTLKSDILSFFCLRSHSPESMGQHYSGQTGHRCSHRDTCKWHGSLQGRNMKQ